VFRGRGAKGSACASGRQTTLCRCLQKVRHRLAQFLGLLGHRLRLRLYEFRLQTCQSLYVPHLPQPPCELKCTREVALGIMEEVFAKLRAARNIAGSDALQELEPLVSALISSI
jgi:hypothetical protein